jgi:hypothetical protein
MPSSQAQGATKMLSYLLVYNGYQLKRFALVPAMARLEKIVHAKFKSFF